MENPSIVVLGCNGMLGSTVLKYFLSIGATVKSYDRTSLDASMPNVLETLESLSQTWQKSVIIINCIGVIPQKHDVAKQSRLYLSVNSVFPHVLSGFCDRKGFQLVHISTDCVYDGVKGDYAEDDPHTETNIYGLSKSCGEPQNAMIVRTSIVGEEKCGGTSLLEWVRSQAGKPIRGFKNHKWNGVTCLELAKILHVVIEKKLHWKGVRHIVSPNAVSKFELVEIINKVYSLNCTIEAFETPASIDKTLQRSRDLMVSSLNVKDLMEQVQELRNFFLTMKAAEIA